jgi:GGDEF domain-containing protein
VTLSLPLQWSPAKVAGHATPWLVLGGPVPAVAGSQFTTDAGAACAGILLVGHVEQAELLSALEQAPDPAVPVADFGNNPSLRRDFVADVLDEEALADLRHSFVPIWRQLSLLPFRATREDRAELSMLRALFARDAPALASFSLVAKSLVTYALFGQTPGVRTRLESLADLDLLRRRHFNRTHSCRKCDSSRLHAYEACVACASSDLVEEPLVHHYRCGWQAAESAFMDGHLLVCPKCHRELRHFGVDYGKPGSITTCRACGAANADPVVQFVCLDCSATTPTEEAAATDWYHYDLTEDGVHALQDGRLPTFHLGRLLEAHTRTYSPAEFRLLCEEGMRIASRYERPFAAARLSLANVEALRQQCGSTEIHLAFRLAAEAIAEVLRDTDYVTVDGASSIVICFPETARSAVARIIERLQRVIRTRVTKPIEITAEIAEGDKVVDLLVERQ